MELNPFVHSALKASSWSDVILLFTKFCSSHINEKNVFGE